MRLYTLFSYLYVCIGVTIFDILKIADLKSCSVKMINLKATNQHYYSFRPYLNENEIIKHKKKNLSVKAIWILSINMILDFINYYFRTTVNACITFNFICFTQQKNSSFLISNAFDMQYRLNKRDKIGKKLNYFKSSNFCFIVFSVNARTDMTGFFICTFFFVPLLYILHIVC